MSVAFQPGGLVSLRGRDWVVLPSADPELLLLKPLGGAEDEVTGLFLPLGGELPRDARFEPPSAEDLGDFASARLLHDAARLALRNGAGPFRCLAKLSFRPRSYQMVPLVMALRQDVTRLLIADDVGVGKTVEALLVVRELLERRRIRRFAVLCLPQLCEQWQAEIRAKLDLEAVVIRSSTQARLDRQVQGDTSVYDHYPFQVISIDFIKSDARRDVFVEQCPELVIVDEAHACARPAGAAAAQQQRYHLVSRIAAKRQHLLLLTATPHSGKAQEFQSLLGLLKPGFDSIDLPTATQPQRRELARHFVQRKRADVEKWLNEDTPFPRRDAFELSYELSPDYRRLFQALIHLSRRLIAPAAGEPSQRAHYWSALGLLRGVMSSPAAGMAMLHMRLSRLTDLARDEQCAAAAAVDIPEDDLFFNPVGDSEPGREDDHAPVQVVERAHWSEPQRRQLREFAAALQALAGPAQDRKLLATARQLTAWLKEAAPQCPVVFCRYVETARYLGEQLGPLLRQEFKGLELQVLTSELPDELRRQRIEAMGRSRLRVLIATDCLSEGINLQQHFTAVLHYDLPWNPNRLEQREGRVDRFGQTAPVVKACLLYGADNPIDGVVLDVLLRKVREIRRATGINVPFPEDSRTVIETITHALLLNPERGLSTREGAQGLLFEDGDFEEGAAARNAVTDEVDAALAQQQACTSVFAQHALRAQDIEADLRAVDEALGDPRAVERFVTRALPDLFGAQVRPQGPGWRIVCDNLAPALCEALPGAAAGAAVRVSFQSPTPVGFTYLGRNHAFVEQLCQLVMTNTLVRQGPRAARAAVIRTHAVATKTTLLLLRCRHVIEAVRDQAQLVAEEMLLWGWHGLPPQRGFLDHAAAEALLANARAASELSPQARAAFLANELKTLARLDAALTELAQSQARRLVEVHERFSALMDQQRSQRVHPVLPMDLLGVYVLLPEVPR
ncbi:helicase-related protein [Azohydromonas caseinilytica]|uniref:DEAD/DEAH box helicase n=1 Tax=Azohydromonas caseinilytica TaxID=2728836 RepID=A0A848FB79_9BURK|nr:helicase-related protein [Azohydromonas caseinilytica]NML15450.1 DEAD/DEAH box helicase [Azohydromonas caseinilytica]